MENEFKLVAEAKNVHLVEHIEPNGKLFGKLVRDIYCLFASL
jgi:hypothetical protein